MLFGEIDVNPIPIPADATASLCILEAFGLWLGMRLSLVLQITHLWMPELPLRVFL